MSHCLNLMSLLASLILYYYTDAELEGLGSPFFPQSEHCGAGYERVGLKGSIFDQEGDIRVYETFDEAMFNCKRTLECFGVTKDGMLHGES